MDASLSLLTRPECANTPLLRARLDEALRALGQPLDYDLVDVDSLPATDPRGGYGTPTILVGRHDLFGLHEPPVPHPPPT